MTQYRPIPLATRQNGKDKKTCYSCNALVLLLKSEGKVNCLTWTVRAVDILYIAASSFLIPNVDCQETMLSVFIYPWHFCSIVLSTNIVIFSRLVHSSVEPLLDCYKGFHPEIRNADYRRSCLSTFPSSDLGKTFCFLLFRAGTAMPTQSVHAVHVFLI